MTKTLKPKSKNIYETVMIEHYSADSEVDESTGELLPTFGEVSTRDLVTHVDYDVPVHRSLWEQL